jgi:aerobic-type carbon monoxide dehydrogenase small subunit (CoxS/CutS family)
MDSTIAFTVNGQPRTVTTDPQRPLLDVLREELKLTGTKYGCGEGHCRACTVLLNGKPVPQRPRLCLAAVAAIPGGVRRGR